MPGAREAQPGFGNYFSADCLVSPRVAHRSPMHLCKHNGHKPPGVGDGRQVTAPAATTSLKCPSSDRKGT